MNWYEMTHIHKIHSTVVGRLLIVYIFIINQMNHEQKFIK